MPRYRVRRRKYFYDVVEVDATDRDDAINRIEDGDYSTVTDNTYDYTSDSEDWEVEELLAMPRPRRGVWAMADAAAEAVNPNRLMDLNEFTRILRVGSVPPSVAAPVTVDESVEDVQFEEDEHA